MNVEFEMVPWVKEVGGALRKDSVLKSEVSTETYVNVNEAALSEELAMVPCEYEHKKAWGKCLPQLQKTDKHL